jgi:hypothetical protein
MANNAITIADEVVKRLTVGCYSDKVIVSVL